MNIVFVIVGVDSPKSHATGVTYAVGLGKALIAKGCSLTIITSKAGETLFKNLGLDAEFLLVDNKDEIVGPGLIYVTILMMRRMFKAGFILRKKEFNQDTVVFALSNLLCENFPLLFAKGKSVIRTSIFLGSPNLLKGFRELTGGYKLFSFATLLYLQHRLAVPCMKYGGDIIIASNEISHQLQNIGIRNDKMMGLDLGLDWDIINSATPSGEKFDASWGRMYSPQKQCDDLLEIWEEVVRSNRNAKLAVIGDVERKLKPGIEQKKLQRNIELTGLIGDEQKYKVMKGSSLFLFPSYAESTPQMVLEAMACGLPVVAYDLPIYQSYCPKGMVRVPVGDKHAFAEAVIGILNDDERRRQLADEAAILAPKYSWDTAADNFISEVTRRLNNRIKK